MKCTPLIQFKYFGIPFLNKIYINISICYFLEMFIILANKAKAVNAELPKLNFQSPKSSCTF